MYKHNENKGYCHTFVPAIPFGGGQAFGNDSRHDGGVSPGDKNKGVCIVDLTY